MAEANSKSRKKHVRKIYWPNCQVCQFMQKNPGFRLRVMQSKYFQPSGHESLSEVIHSFGDPFTTASAYLHMQRHQTNDLITARKRFAELAQKDPHNTGPLPIKSIPLSAVEGTVVSDGEHELALDEFIREGHDKLKRKEMAISATNFLAAIKIKSDINKNTKDRRLDMIKSFFASGGKTDAAGG